MKKYLLAAALVPLVVPSVSTASISSHDQYILELINRARANPTAEATRLSGNTYNANGGSSTYNGQLNEGVPSGKEISTSPKQALAFDLNLDGAAERHTTDMLNNDFFDHDSPTDNSTPDTRIRDDSGYISGAYSSAGWGENIAAGGTSGDLLADADLMYELLFVDPNYSGRGHRLNIMNDDWESIGISFMEQGGTVRLTQNFGRITESPNDISYITGVAYDDTSGNSFFNPGEELINVNVEAFEAGTLTSAGTATTATFGSGGYTLGLTDGDYDLVFTGSLGELRYDGVTVSGSNLKFDYTNATVTAVPIPGSAYLFGTGLIGFIMVRKGKFKAQQTA